MAMTPSGAGKPKPKQSTRALGGDRPQDTRFTPQKPFKPTPQAQAWAAPRTIFVPPVFTKPKVKPKPKPPPRYDPGATKLAPGKTAKQAHIDELHGMVKEALGRREFSLGVKGAPTPPPNVSDAVATAADIAAMNKYEQKRGEVMVYPLVGGIRLTRPDEVLAWRKKQILDSDLSPHWKLHLLGEAQDAYGRQTAPAPIIGMTKAAGQALENWGTDLAHVPGNLVGSILYPQRGSRISGLPPAASQVGNVAGTLEPVARPISHVVSEGGLEAVAGKGPVNLVLHGDVPNGWKDWAGLGADLAMILPVGKPLRLAKSLAAAKTAGNALERAHLMQFAIEGDIAMLEAKVADGSATAEEIAHLEQLHAGRAQIDAWIKANKRTAKTTEPVSAAEAAAGGDEHAQTVVDANAARPAVTGRLKYSSRAPVDAEHAQLINNYNDAVEEYHAAAAAYKPYREIKASELDEAGKKASVEFDRAQTKLQAAKNDELFYRLNHEINPQAVSTPERQALAQRLVDEYTARSGGLPPRADTVESMLRTIDFIDTLTHRGRKGRMWYEKSAKAILKLTRGNKEKAVKVAQLLAIYSPQQPILGNTSLAIRALNQYSRTGKVLVGQEWQREAAEKVLSGGDQYLTEEAAKWKGRKTNNFSFNFIEDINKRLFKKLGLTGNEVTSDLWMARAFGYLTDAVSQGRYDVIESVVRQIAKERGWKPKQAQAAIWTAIKDASDDVTANIDFAGGLSQMHGQLNYEAIPGLSVAPDLHHAYNALSPEAQRAFLTEMGDLVDNFLDEIGLVGAGSEHGPGTYVNDAGALEQNLGARTRLPMSLAESGSYALPPAERATLDFVSAAIGRALKQDSVAWVRPFIPRARSHTDTIVYEIGRRLGDDEAAALATQLGESYGVIHMGDDGFMIRDFRDKPAKADFGKTSEHTQAQKRHQAEFQQLANDAVGAHVSGESVDPVYYASDGNLVRSSQYDSLAEDARRAGAPSDAPGHEQALRATEAADRLARDAEAVIDRHLRGFRNRLRSESGRLTPGALRADPTVERTLQVNDLTQRMPGSRSQATRRLIEQPADAVSQAMMGEGRIASAARATPGLRHASAMQRAMKQGGRMMERAARAAWGPMKTAAKALPPENSLEDVAHFYYRQLPRAYQNAKGLQLVRDLQAQTLVGLEDGSYAKALMTRKQILQGSMKQATLPQEDLIRAQIREVERRLTDIRPQAENLRVKLARLDQAIAANIPRDPKILAAMDHFATAREELLGVKNENIKGFLADELGIEFGPGEKKVFVGHRRPKPPPGARQSLLPGGVATGGVRSPAELRHQRMGTLLRQARLRDSTHVVVGDWQAAQTFSNNTAIRDLLAKAGTPFEPGKLHDGDLLVNPEAEVIPAAWKDDPEGILANASDDPDGLLAAAKEIQGTYLAGNGATYEERVAEVEAMLAAADAAGMDTSKLRVIKKEDAERFFEQFKRPGKSGPAMSLYDGAVDAAVASIVFARLGYIPKNTVANLLLVGLHQGGYLAANLPRAAELYRWIGGPEGTELRHMLEPWAGSGGAVTLKEEAKYGKGIKGRTGGVVGTAAKIPGGVAGFMGATADTPWRLSALLHEAAAEGVISKYSMRLSDEDKANLIRVFGDPHNPQAHRIAERAEEAMVDFSRLTPTQKRNARRLFVIPSWLWSGSRYPFHFAATHPGRALALGYLAAGAPGAPVDVPSVKDIVHGHDFTQGIDTPWGRIRTQSMDPVSTPIGLGQAALNTARGGISPYSTKNTLWSEGNPVFRASQGWASGGGWGALESLVPSPKLVADLIHPHSSKYYPDDSSRLGRLKRELGVLPIHVNDSGAPALADSWKKGLKDGTLSRYDVEAKILDRKANSLSGKGKTEEAFVYRMVANDVHAGINQIAGYEQQGPDALNRLIMEGNVARQAAGLKPLPLVTQEQYDEVTKAALEAKKEVADAVR